jgi:hypothetical protein
MIDELEKEEICTSLPDGRSEKESAAETSKTANADGRSQNPSPRRRIEKTKRMRINEVRKKREKRNEGSTKSLPTFQVASR